MQLVWQKFGYIVTWRYVTVWHPLGGFSCGNYHFSHSKVWNQMSLYRYSIAFYAKNLVGKLHATSLFGFKYDGVDVYHMHLCILDFFKVDYITLFSHGVSFIVFGICQLYFVSPGIKVVIFVWYSYIQLDNLGGVILLVYSLEAMFIRALFTVMWWSLSRERGGNSKTMISYSCLSKSWQFTSWMLSLNMQSWN